MKVRIVKALESRWYHYQIGSILNVGNPIGNAFSFSPDGYTSFYIDKSDCEILPEENQPEPFDLERALKGEKVVTRCGDPVTNIVKFPDSIGEMCVYGVHDGEVNNWTIQGKFNTLRSMTPLDLLMAPKPSEYVTKWVNIHFNGAGHYWHGLYNTEEKAKEDIDNDPINKYFATVPITFKRPS